MARRGTDAQVLGDILSMIPTEDLLEELSIRAWDEHDGLDTIGAWKAALRKIEDDLGQKAIEARDHQAACAQHGA